jgi:hypothetical protein
MTFTSKAGRMRRHACAAGLAALSTIAAGDARSQQFTLDELARLGGPVAADEFPLVVGGTNTVVRAKFYEKRTFTIGDGSRHVMSLFRTSNCWLREGTATTRTVIDCRGKNGPGVFIPVLFVTPESASRSTMPFTADLVLTSRNAHSLAGYMPVELQGLTPPYGGARVFWIRLIDPQFDSLTLSVPAVPAALVLCVPFAASECADHSVPVANLDSTPPGGAPPKPPHAPAPPAGSAPPPAADRTPPPAPAPPPRPIALHYVIKPAASGMLPGWTPDRMAKRLVALVASTRGAFVLKSRDGSEVASSEPPELTPSGDAVVAWSGDRPAGPADLVFRGTDAVAVVPGTQSPEPQAASSTLAGPRLHRSDLVSFAEFRIAAPFLYDQWQARTEIVTKVYGQEQADAEDDLCQFSLLIPRSGLLSFMTISLGLNLEEDAGKRFLVSPPVIMPSQLMRADGEPFHLDVRSTAADPACVGQRRKLAPATASGGATAAWRVSEVPGSPSTGRMDIRPSSLTLRGRWLLGLYSPDNISPGSIAAGSEDVSRSAADLPSQIFNSLTAFLDDFRERSFERGGRESQAVGADLAVISAADSAATAFAEKNVIIGKFRQPPPGSDRFRLDAEGNRRLSAFTSNSASAGGEVSFRTVGQTIRHYTQLFGDFSGDSPPIAIYLGSAHPVHDACLQWKAMTAEVARLPGGPQVFGLVFADAGSEEIGRQLGQNGRDEDEALAADTRSPTCQGEGGPSLLFVSFPDAVSSPQTILRSAFSVLERWAARGQN